jgi:hypothetical protein
MGKLLGFIITSLPDNKKLCAYGTTPIIDAEFNRVLTSPNWGKLETKNITLESDNVMFYIVINEKLAYAVITEKNYYATTVYEKFLPELIGYVSSVIIANINATHHKKWFTDLLNKYSDTKIDMLHKQVEDVKITMTQNIQDAISRGDKLTDLEDKSRDLGDKSKQFEMGSKKLSRNMMWRNWKVTGMISAVVIIVLTIVILALAL